MTEPTVADLRRWRRDLHQIPETDFDLPETIAYVEHELAEVIDTLHDNGQKTQILKPCKSALCLFVDRGSEHATALRSDMDALPVAEKTDLPFASKHTGRMHACGHDGHMAMLIGLAHHVAEHADELPRSVLLVFEPAEETTGGAKNIVQSKIFDDLHVDRIFGFHLWPDLPKGMLASRPGALLAASHETTVTFIGKASHIAKSEQGCDALASAAMFYNDCAAYLNRCATQEPCLLKFGHMQAGEVRNQIAGRAVLEGSLRTFSNEMDGRIRQQVPTIAENVAQIQGCTQETYFNEGYPPVLNDPALFKQTKTALGDELHIIDNPLLISDDFAWYQKVLPGVFLLLGTGTHIPLHSSTFNFDEEILLVGLHTYEKLIRIP